MIDPTLWYIVFFIVGAIIGSFSYVIALRLHTGRAIARGRSQCDSCGVLLQARDLIPLISFLVHRGRCRVCGSRIHPMHFVAELVFGAIFVVLWHIHGVSLLLPLTLIFVTVVGIIVLYDLAHTIIPNILVYPLILLGIGIDLVRTGSVFATLETAVVAFTIAGAFALVWLLSRGRAMGLGDAKFVLALVFFVGASVAITGVLFSFWMGAVISVLLLLYRRKGRTMSTEVPFAPYLALGFLCAYLFDIHILDLLLL